MLKRMTMAAICVLGCAALTADAVAAGGAAKPMKGRTKQHRAIRLSDHGRSVQIKHFSIQLRCHDGSYLIDQESGFQPTGLRAGGHIRDHQVGSTDDVWIRGRMHGHVLRGAIRVHDRWGKVQCDSRWVRFHAHS